MTTPTSEILNLTADHIEQYGWEQQGGWFAKYGERACLEGAGKAVCANELGTDWTNVWYGTIKPAIRTYLQERHPGDSLADFPWVWNDSLAQSEAEVVEVLRAVALIQAARENSSVTEKVSA